MSGPVAVGVDAGSTTFKVVVVDEGRVVGLGSHAVLLRSNEKYRRLMESQTLTLEKEVCE